MAESDEESGYDVEMDDPALKNHSRTAFQAKHVVGKALKYAVIGAIAGAALLGIGSAVFGWATVGAVPVLGPIAQILGVATEGGRQLIGGFLGPMAMSGLGYGALAGAAVGAIAGISGASEAADDEEDRLREKMRLAEARKERLDLLREQHHQQRLALMQTEPSSGLAANLYAKDLGHGGKTV